MLAPRTLAQIVPDATLGAESSLITTDVPIDSRLIDRIDGGALRESALFHSFQDFNVRPGQQVYFSNPAAVTSIVSRVTGANLSEIYGTLGVLGSADLYLLNPLGILFGADARLDVHGSFIGSTASGVEFENGYRFGTDGSEVPPLLALDSPLGLASWLSPATGTLASEGELTAGQDLALVARNLDLQGRLAAAGKLSLLASEDLTIRDSAGAPFIADAGAELLLQAEQTLDIVALSHPDSGLFSGSSLVLRAANPVGGDAHFFAGDDFRIEQLDGSLGDLESPVDPIIRASGDVSFDNYVGASLHILAGGSITIPGKIVILGPDLTGNAINPVDNPDLANVTTSDGQTLVIDGVARPTVDLRAGTTAFAPQGLAGDLTGIDGDPAGFAPAVGGAGGTGTSADIRVGAIINPGGPVFLTNQYAANPALAGDIAVVEIITSDFNGGGSVVVDSKGDLTTEFIDTSGGDAFEFLDTFNFDLFDGDGGDITLLADGEIFLPFRSALLSFGLAGGEITLASDTSIVQEGGPLEDGFSLIETDTVGFDEGGDIRLTAPLISLGGEIFATLDGDGVGGSIFLQADRLEGNGLGLITRNFGFGDPGTVEVDADTIVLDNSFIGSFTRFGIGDAGDVTVTTDSLVAINGSQIGSRARDFALGDAGNVTVTAADSIELDGFLPGDVFGIFLPSGIFSTVEPNAEGSGGSVTITTGTLAITNGAQVRTSSLGIGDAGDIDIEASNSVLIDGAVYDTFEDFTFPSNIVSEVVVGGEGAGGNVTLVTGRLDITNGGVISVSTDSFGDAGDIGITARESVNIGGVTTFDGLGLPEEFSVRESGLRSESLEAAVGSGGNITIIAPSFFLGDGATLEVTTAGEGDAGDIQLKIDDTITVDAGAVLANTLADSTGRGGSIDIDPRLVIIRNGGQVLVDSRGSGESGSIAVVSDQLRLDNGLISAEADSVDGGNISLNLGPLLLLRNGSLISATAGRELGLGNGGNVLVSMPDGFIVAVDSENSDITANAFEGNGGNVDIVAQGLFGIEFRPALTPRSDITASSEFGLQGDVNIETPDVDPNSGLVELPTGFVDASRLVAQGCGSSSAGGIGEFTVTGRGGLPPSPEQPGVQSDLAAWETLDADADISHTPEHTGSADEIFKEAAIAPVERLVEFQGWTVGREGEVILTATPAAAAPHSAWQSTATCQAAVP